MAASETFSFPNLQEEEDEDEGDSRHEHLILSLPKQKGWSTTHIHLYQGFWYYTKHLRGVLYCQSHFRSLDSDLLLITIPKSGTIWLKAIAFSLVYRRQHPVNALSIHPLTTHNPHDLVLFLEYVPNSAPNQFQSLPDLSSLTPPRLFASHIPFPSLPPSVRESGCKIVYLCRDPRDTFISHWHFFNKLRRPEDGVLPLEEAFEGFCQGVSSCGPFWDHVLGYWKASLEMPSRVLFLKYEDMKGDPEFYLRRLAEFLGCPFSLDEDKEGVVTAIVELCSFDHLSTLEVNRNGKQFHTGVENKAFFRRGEVGDWANYLTPDMSERLQKIIEEKLQGSGLKF